MATNYAELSYVDLQTVANKLDINVATLRNARDNGELTVLKGVSKSDLTTWEWVNAWLASKVVNPPTEQGE